MKKGLTILFTLITVGAFSQTITAPTTNPDGNRFAYQTMQEALTTTMMENQKVTALENGMPSSFTIKKIGSKYVPDSVIVIDQGNGYAMVRDISQSQAINVKWAGIAGDSTDVSTKLRTLLRVSAAIGLPVDGQGLTIYVNDVTIPAKAALRNITLKGNDTTKTILHIGSVGQVPNDGYLSGLTLDNVTFTGTCSYGLITSNVTDARIDKITFTNLTCANDAWYLNDMYEATITAPRFTGITVGAGKACLYSPKGLNGVAISGFYSSAFTDFGIKLTGGSNLTLTSPTIQGAVTGLYVTGVLGLNVNNQYYENDVNPIIIDDAVGAPYSINFVGGGYINAPYSTHPHLDQNNGVMVKVKNAQVSFTNTKFFGVYANSGKNIASVDGTAIITLIRCNVTGSATADLRQYLYKESTATSIAGYIIEQSYTNNATLKVDRSQGFGNSHISVMRSTTGEVQESTAWAPPVNGSGLQTITDVWSKHWTTGNLDTSIFFRNTSIYNQRYLILGRTGVTNASGFIHLPEANSSLATGLTLYPLNQRTGAAGAMFTVLNTDSTIIAQIKNDGTIIGKNVQLSAFLNSHYVLAAPFAGNGSPTFRALDVTDIPGLDASKITTGTLSTTRGGTGLTAYAAGDMLYGNGNNGLSVLSGNITTTRKFLTESGNGTVSGTPIWNTISSGDIPDLSATYQKKLKLTTIGTSGNAALIGDSLNIPTIPTTVWQRTGTTISTLTAGDNLSLTGSVKIADGTQGAGKVFTSDASGNGTWQTATGGAGTNYGYTTTTVTTSTATVSSIAGNKTVVLVNFSGTATITLPSAAANADKEVTVKSITANSVNITPVFASDANTIGASSFSAYTYHSDGTTWYLIARN